MTRFQHSTEVPQSPFNWHFHIRNHLQIRTKLPASGSTFDIVHSVHCSHGCQGQTVTCLTNFNENAAKCNICKMVVACKRGYIQQPHEMLTNTTLYKCEAVAKRLLQLLLCARCSLLALMLISQTKNLTIDPHVKVILVIRIKISL